MNVGILGGGLTGLTLASRLSTADVEVLEKNQECGGLCRSLQEEGFTFDYGGAHIIYSRNQEPVDFMLKTLGDNYEQHRRNNKVYFKGRYVKYPFENGLSELPKEDTFECLYYYLQNKYKKPENFKEWIYYTFGKGIAEKYLIPYNEKIWNIDASEMSLHWVDGRVPKPPMEDIVKSAVGVETEGYTHQLYFYYPKHGGIQAIIRALEQKAKITRNFTVKTIRKKNKTWVVSDGEVEKEYDKLVSTIPLFDLINALEAVPAPVANALKGLKYNSLIAVLMGVDNSDLNNYTAVYYPDSNFLANRVAFPKNFSENNVPKNCSSIVAEITSNRADDSWRMTDQEILAHVQKYFQSQNVLNENEVCYSKVLRSRYAYVIYDLKYLQNIKWVMEYLSKIGITPLGRFAEFEYLNMDACIVRAMEMARKINAEFHA
jgi:protoporphyrinogen oxidase